MATDVTKVSVGAGVISIGEYVPAGGAATNVDVGHNQDPFDIRSSFENFDVESERVEGIILTNPNKSGWEVAFKAIETIPGRLAQLIGLAAGQVTGTAPNQTIRVNARVFRPLQIVHLGKGPGTLKERTTKFWRCQPVSIEPIQHGKAVVQAYAVVFRVLFDDSVNPPTGEYWQQVDA